MNNKLIHSLKQMRGNTRTIVFTEPLWGIPFNLYAPYASVYMLALGMHDSQIGLVTSISLALQMVWALLSGAITDKLGRKRATYLSDLVSWVIPSLLFAAAQGYVYFLVGLIIQSAWRVAHTSWSCLIAESVPQEDLVNVYTWIYIAGLLSAFVAPITGLLVARYNVVITMRGVYVFACLMMTAKFILFNHFVKETPRGIQRMEESKNQPLLSMLSEYRGVFRIILRSPTTLYTLGIMLATGVCNTIQGTFWAILVTEKLRIPAAMIAYYPFARSIIMLLFFFIVLPYFSRRHFKNSLLLGLGGLFVSQVLLIGMPPGQPWLLLVTVVLDACSAAIYGPMMDSLLVLAVDAGERARIFSIVFVIVIAFTSPFGWIAGQLSEINRTLPFVVNAGFYLLAVILVLQLTRVMKHAVLTPATPEKVSA